MPTERLQNPLDWDVPLRRYCKARGNSSREFLNSRFGGEKPGGTPASCDDEGDEICDRLYRDFFQRRQKLALLQKEKEQSEEERHKARMARRFNCDVAKMAEKQRLHHTRMQEEHQTLGQLMSTLRELEAERKALQNICPLRLYPPMEYRDSMQEMLYHQLCDLGDPKRNSVAINSLLVPSSSDTVAHFISSAIQIRDQQKIILDEFDRTKMYDESIFDILTMHVIETFEATIDELETQEPLDLPQDIDDTARMAAYVEAAANKLVNNGFLEDLKHERRELLVEMNILRLSMLHQLIRLDIDWRSLLAKLRLSKFHVRGYDSNEVENLKESDWFRDLGSSTSLRNSMRIRNDAERIFARAIDILVNNKQRPQIPAELDPAINGGNRGELGEHFDGIEPDTAGSSTALA